jgi:hypothetical protein
MAHILTSHPEKPAKVRLDLLPAELQLEIFSNLENTDLKAARAVSRQLRDNASPALFRSVVACARYVALGTFQKIALDSVLQKYVKEIVFDGTVYNRVVAQNQFTYERQNSNYEELRGSASFWGLRTRYARSRICQSTKQQLMVFRWKRYQELYKEQEDMITSHVLLQTLARALEETSNVSSIVYSPHSHLLRPEAKLVRDLIPRDNKGPDPNNRNHGLDQRPSQHPFLHLIGAIYLSQYTGVRELRIDAYDKTKPGNPFTFDFFDSPDANSVQASQYLFKNLERCELNISTSHDDTTFWPSGHCIKSSLVHLSHLLAIAEDLRHLAFHIAGWQSIFAAPSLNLGPGQPLLCRFGLGHTWSKLRTASLKGVHSSGDDFLDFVKRQSNTLRSLSIQDCTLNIGIWADIVDEVVYSTSITAFILASVNERQVPTGDGDGSVRGSDGLNEWLYEGDLEVSRDGERKFVNLNLTLPDHGHH